MATIYRVQVLHESHENPVWINLNNCKTLDEFTASFQTGRILDWQGFPNGTIDAYFDTLGLWDTFKMYSQVEKDGNEMPFRTFCLLFSEDYEAFKRSYKGKCSEVGATPAGCVDMDGFVFALPARTDTDLTLDYDLDWDPDYDLDYNSDYSPDFDNHFSREIY